MQGSVPIAQPAGFVPVHASGFADGQGKAVTVSQAAPLPVAGAQAFAASSAPLVGSITDTAAHNQGPFTPQLAREIWATLVGTGASGKAQLLRSTDGGATMAGLTAGAMSGRAGPLPASPAASSTSRSPPRATRRPAIIWRSR
jgi:hypothetical protein